MRNRYAEAFYREEHLSGREVVGIDDVDNVIDALLAGSDSENMAELHSLQRPNLVSGFPDHEFLVGVSREYQVGVVAYMDGAGNFVSLGDSATQGSVGYYLVGHEREFPERSEISIDLVRRAVKEFVASSGQRPTCIRWQEPDFW
ncbi:Imm1 family immunity protein [Streptomyces rochei]|uniref:Imm1 family immunity protein n=1 Tax=Streptomyces rochei TaxID=1928 RepID=UPI00339F32BB